MNIVFINMGTRQYPKYFVKSIKKHMPRATIIQITDMSTPKIEGVTQIIRHNVIHTPQMLPKFFFESIMNSGIEEMIYCDADIVFNGDVSNVLDDDYDVAICKRYDSDGTGDVYRHWYPYNSGFMAVKNPDFWKKCYDKVLEFETLKFGIGQHIIGLVINSGQLKIKYLDGTVYNRAPTVFNDFDNKVKVWHFKGELRKGWIENWI